MIPLASLNGCALRAVMPRRPDGKKLLLPIAPGADLAALLSGHLAGHLPPVSILTDDGRTWTERNAVALAACPVIGAEAAWGGQDFDCAGPGHKTTATPASAHQGAMAAADMLHDAGLPYLVAASGGGAGRHVWCPHRMPARMAAWLVALLRDQVLAAVPGADIEVRPGSDRAPGSAFILPCGGAFAGHGGGVVLRQHPGRAGAIEPLLAAWHRCRDNEERVAARRVQYQAAYQHDGEVRSADVPLERVLESLTKITEHRTSGSFRAHCPIHGGDHALTGNTKRRLWRCWACERSGAGDAASYTLAAFLLGDPPPRQVFAALSGMIGASHAVCA